MKKYERRCIFFYVVGVLLISLILSLFFNLNFFKGIRILLGLTYVLFLPGFFVVRLFLWKRELDWVEKLGLSIGLSIALVILVVMFTNVVLNIPITALTNFLVILGLILLICIIKIYEKEITKLKKFLPKFLR